MKVLLPLKLQSLLAPIVADTGTVPPTSLARETYAQILQQQGGPAIVVPALPDRISVTFRPPALTVEPNRVVPRQHKRPVAA